ncbi:hypothetical protein RhiirC2_777424 [Rhizophagus irregularis]|uniref:Crinkler family protein n=1 Tax=Rhizophagus irregularis TaxID=588596 RepID=A0A2N1NEI7_9GLOM|nr:hypothetical protein RhiirC2_777424 [Rhizophagus irregularis]
MSSIVYEAIKALSFTKEEKDALRAFFINNPDKKTEAEELLPTLEDEEVVGCLKNLLKPDQPSATGNKRRKISDFEGDSGDNESLAKVWNAFKHATLTNSFLTMSEEVYYLLGFDDDGNKLSTIFIRRCYNDLSAGIISESINLRRWRITGNPGIGKTFLGYYLLYKFAEKNETVIYHQHGRSAILFSEKQVISGSVHEFRDYLGREDVWYIVDARKPKEYRAKTILICSPQVNYYKKFDDHGVKIIHRLVHIRTNVPEEEEAEEGTVEPTFSESSTSIDLEPLAIDSFSEPFTSSTSNKPSVAQNDSEGVPYYSQFSLEFASDYVAEGVINRLSEINKQALLDFVKTSVDINEYGSLRGIIFERLAHRKLLNGGTFECRSLDGKGDGYDVKIQKNPKMEKLLFSNIDEIQANKYCIPTQMNNKSFDAFIHPAYFFQMTIAKNHPIIKSGLEKLIKRASGDIDFHFVVPKSIFSDYKEQPLHTTKGTVLRNKPSWLDRFKQYVIDVDLKLKDI